MYLIFNKQKNLFKAYELLKQNFIVEVIPVPIYIEVKYFDGVAPCGFCVKVKDRDFKEIKFFLFQNGIEIDYAINIK